MVTKTKPIRVNLEPFWDESLSNEYIAQKLGLNKNTVSSYKNGNVRNPKIEVLLKFRDFFAERQGKKIILEDLLSA